MILTTGRAGSMEIHVKDPNIKDITSVYFNHEVWKRSPTDPVPDMPLDIQLEIINRCNLSCESCPILRQTRDKSLLELNILLKIVDEAAAEGVCYFTLCGIGEAGLHPDLFNLISYIRNKNIEIKGIRKVPLMPTVLISNLIWTKNQIEKCIENPPDLLSVSLAGLTKEEIELRRKPLRLDIFKKNLSTIYKQRNYMRDYDKGICPILHLSTHIYPYEMITRRKEIDVFIEEWLEICDAVVIKPTMVDQHHQKFEQFVTNIDLLDNNKLKYDNISMNHFERTAPCMEVSRRLSIDSDGNVWCGHHNSEDFGPHLGNVYRQTLREIWHGDTMNQFRREVRAGVFHRQGCKLCGGEIRDEFRNKPNEMEKEIRFDAVC